MPLLNPADRPVAEAMSRLVFVNPFLPERIDLERQALGNAFVGGEVVWSADADFDSERPNVLALARCAEALIESMRARLNATDAAADELRLYEDVACYCLYYRVQADLRAAAEGSIKGATLAAVYERFVADYAHLFRAPGRSVLTRYEPGHLFALFFQLRRAFVQIFTHLVGGSLPIARLRAAAWQSVFTHDVRRYSLHLYGRAADFTTLVTGPSGTGKELVARAVALSRYVPYEPRNQKFAADVAELFIPLNLSALSPTLIESELFGHRKGAFTGALDDRPGYLETCSPYGTVFLDEVGELDESIQVKLLRVLQDRTFQRAGDTKPRRFEGKLIAATNRDLSAEMAAGRFRRDFYYRLCSDLIRTPSLCEQIVGGPGELRRLVGFIARRVAGDGAAAADGLPSLADEVCEVIARDLGSGYAWAGNFRELEQCVRNVLIRRRYDPPRVAADSAAALADEIRAGSLTADDLVSRYCAIIYAQEGENYEATGRRLGLDRRTVKAKVAAQENSKIAGMPLHAPTS